MEAGGPHALVVEGKNRVEVKDVLVGEVWFCSGQSNMEWSLADTRDADLEIPTANHPEIRFITCGNQGSQTPVDDFDGKWEVCSQYSAPWFSAIGYYFGREIQKHEKVPVGLIDNSWGGSSCEAWIRRDKLEGNPLYDQTLAKADELAAEQDQDALFNRRVADWMKRAAAAKAAGQPEPGDRPWLRDNVNGQIRPCNLWNGRIEPIMPYAIRGAIWYQGETNAGRSYQYREMFPLMIQLWRDEWGQGDFPFYWVQLADFLDERPEPGESGWAELREAQTMTLDRLPHTGQAVIIDLGAAADIHPRNKLDVSKRLARLALARDYNHDFVSQSPRYDAMKIDGDKILVRFKDVDKELVPRDGREVLGFTIAGADRKWHRAQAKIVDKDWVAVHSDTVKEPVAVRYAWADNPVCNLYNTAGLPVTPFRTDDWPGVTMGAE
jgi:sialate O-acetylesterase